MNKDDYEVARNMVLTRRCISDLCAGWLISLAVLAPLALVRALLRMQGYAFHWLNSAFDWVSFVFIVFLLLWLALYGYGAIGGLFACSFQTHELRKGLLPPLPGKSDSSRGAELMAKRKRARSWLKQSFVANYGRLGYVIIVRLPTYVEEEENLNANLDKIANRLASSANMKYGTWEPLIVGQFSPKFYKFVILRK